MASSPRLRPTNRHRPPGRQPAKRSPALAVAGDGRAYPTSQPLARLSANDAAARSTGADSLPLQLASLHLPGRELPSALAARPDSTPLPPLRRRWQVQVLAGPTLSYRTLPESNAGVAYTASAPGPVTSAPTNVLASRNDPASLERPALGLGAQAQVRRVLSGRWALAFGLGYQEYATRLTLQPGWSPDTLVNHRDTYRLLTAPLQLSYVLGPPRRHLELALLAGAEPGWYWGGRTTEGVACGCTQQTFTPATSSPYHAWNVALSLGLDLRYRLGKPASRWQLVVQPTGRYVVSPFVQSTATGYARRQPYSLGVLAGLAWDWR